MELVLIEGRAERIEYQRQLTVMIKTSWKKQETRRIVWRPTSEDMLINHNDEMWFASKKIASEDGRSKYWNSIGLYSGKGNLRISIEINIPISSRGRTAGFFARDSLTGNVYLLHDGGFGGGQEGVKRDVYCAYTKRKPVFAVSSDGNERPGVIIGVLQSATIAKDVAAFAKEIAAFKVEIRDGFAERPAVKKAASKYRTYFEEGAGKRKRRRMKEIEYVSRHGDIVSALRLWRGGIAKTNERVVKNVLIDLGIARDGRLIELYEVKTNCSRESLYKAIGQIFVHTNKEIKAKRYIVVPVDDEIIKEIESTLEANDIEVLRFNMSKNDVKIIEKA
jgi:hypothetical protein